MGRNRNSKGQFIKGNGASVSGVAAVTEALRKKFRSHGRGFARGMKMAGLLIQRASQLIVPIDTAALKNSAFTRNVGGKEFKVEIIVGYTVIYAIYVHEDMNAKHSSGKEAKFLEKPFRENRKAIIKIVRTETRRG